MNVTAVVCETKLSAANTLFWLLVLAFSLVACGGGHMNNNNTPPGLSKSYWSGGQSCTTSGISPTYSGPPPCSPSITQCDLHAGATEMDFTAIPSGPWFTISPNFGTIPINGNTSIALTWIDVSQLPVGNNTGVFDVEAPGYEDNDQLSFSVNENGTDSNGNPLFKFSFSCPQQ